MNKKIVSVSVVIVTLVFLFLSQATILEAKPKPRTGGGTFDDADFFTPDYNNGGSENFDVGGNRTFNYNCHCSSQPPAKSCSGYISLQVDAGSGFVNEKSDACSINVGQTCSENHVKTFDTADTYTFRVFCDESAGTDYTQPSNEHVVLTVEDGGCVENETQPCPLQQGVCERTDQTCVNGSWSECDYGSYYEEDELSCDELDNDCNGLTDEVDGDSDGSSPCGGLGMVNELLITGLNDDYGNITIFSYSPATSGYNSAWSTDTAGMTYSWSGGEIGDLTHDGKNEFVISRQDDSNYYRLEVWSYNSSSGEWYRLWYTTSISEFNQFFIGDIADFDNDGKNELLIGNKAISDFEVWGNDTEDATGFSLNATVLDCDVDDSDFLYHRAACNMDGDDYPELILQCYNTDTIQIFEWNGSDYEHQQDVTIPTMVIDDMECGDVDRDGEVEVVYCGNDYKSHVLDYSGGTYSVVYNTPSAGTLTQTCSIGDVTNDGWPDWFDASQGGIRVFSYNGSGYESVWSKDMGWSANPPIGGSFIGDADNDEFVEFIFAGPSASDTIYLFENDTVNAKSFENTFNWTVVGSNPNLIIGNFNPYNDDTGVDCNDSDDSIYPGAPEICGDGIDQDCNGEDAVCDCVDGDLDGYYGYDQVSCPTGDDCDDNDYSVNPGAEEICDGVDNDCDDEIDEGCGPVCGDGYCDGRSFGEDCLTCPQDCPSGDRGACCGDGKCDTRKGETSAMCPVDCA